MARKPNVGRDEILDRAMLEFWSRGYRAASMDTLVRSIGTTRASLYAEFGGKEGLFEAALDHYSDKAVTAALGPMADPGAGLAGIEQYFRALVTDAPPEQLARGCLMTSTMTELGDTDPRIAERTHAHFDRVAATFEAALTCARAQGELHPSVTDVPARALSLAAFTQGLWACARSGVPTTALATAVAATLAGLRAHPAPPA